MNKYFIILASLFLFNAKSIASTNDTIYLNLEKAIELSIQNNPSIQKTLLSREILKKQIQGAKSAGMPQIKGSAGFTDNFQLPQQLFPGEIFGMEGLIPVQLGVKYGLTAGIDANQMIYNQEFFTNLKKLDAAKSSVELQSLASIEEMVFNVAQVYIQYQTTVEQNNIVLANLERVGQLIIISEAQYANGIIKKLDVDQIKINKTNLSTEQSSIEILLKQQLNLLKFYMGIEMQTEIQLTDKLDDVDRYPLTSNLLLKDNIDYKLLQQQLALNKLDKKVLRAGYFPVLTAFASYNYTGQANEFNFNEGNYSSFTAGMWGLNLSVSMFDGLKKRRNIQENELKIRQTELDIKQFENAVSMEFNNAVIQILQNEKLVAAQTENMQLAQEVYNITSLSYQEGVAPLTELLNAETGLKEAQSQYLTATINYKLAELQHLKASGQLAKLIEKI